VVYSLYFVLCIIANYETLDILSYDISVFVKKSRHAFLCMLIDFVVLDTKYEIIPKNPSTECAYNLHS